jgi:hypothetical protein
VNLTPELSRLAGFAQEERSYAVFRIAPFFYILPSDDYCTVTVKLVVAVILLLVLSVPVTVMV